MDPAIAAEIAAIADDRESSATTLVRRAMALVGRAGSRRELEEMAAALVQAQPSMAGFRTVSALALRAADPAAELERLAERMARAPAAIGRFAADLLLLGCASGRIRVVTCSRSVMVETALVVLAGRADVTVICGEARPALEGRALAASLAERGIAVELLSDAGLSSAIAQADVLLVGADAICRTQFINKVGTGAICAAAASAGVPAYVLTGREKIVSGSVLETMPLHAGPPTEVWDGAPAGVRVRNPYFEVISTDLLAGVITDGGLVSGDDVEA